MKTLSLLIKRNTKLFFRDKALFFTSLITPAILLVLYSTFLSNVYRDSFLMSIPEFMQNEVSNIIDGCVGGQLISSILAVSCVTVAFCSNMLMVQDRANKTVLDFDVSPVSASVKAVARDLNIGDINGKKRNKLIAARDAERILEVLKLVHEHLARER